MNAFELNTGVYIPEHQQSTYLRYESKNKTEYDEYVTLWVPSTLINIIDINTLEIIKNLAISYHKLFKSPLVLKLTGFNDNLNCRFEARFLNSYGENVNILFLLVNGIPNVISN